MHRCIVSTVNYIQHVTGLVAARCHAGPGRAAWATRRSHGPHESRVGHDRHGSRPRDRGRRSTSDVGGSVRALCHTSGLWLFLLPGIFNMSFLGRCARGARLPRKLAPIFTALSTKAASSNHAIKEVLTREFIRNALYNEKHGYFTAIDVINTPSPVRFDKLWGEWDYRLMLQKLYKEKSEAWYAIAP